MYDEKMTNKEYQACGEAPMKFRAINRRITRGPIPAPDSEGISRIEPLFVNDQE